MSSQVLETTKTSEESPPIPQTEQITSVKPQVTPFEPNSSELPKVNPLSENNASVEINSTLPEEQTTKRESKVTAIEQNNLPEPKELTCETIEPEVNVIEQVLEKIVKNVEEPKTGSDKRKENTETENKSETLNQGQETANGSVPNCKTETVQDEKNATANAAGDEKPTSESEKTTAKSEEEFVNGNGPKQAENERNSEQNEDANSSECINIQELTEHVMNILNDDVVEEVMTEQQLLKKNVDLQQFIVKLIRLLKEKTDLCANLDRQNSALISQAQSLKDVIAITKDLLGIRNMEIEHLHADLTAMEDTIKEERTRHNLSVQHLNEAMSLNEKLKTEYLTQMDLFQKLREKYTEKVVYLTRENQRLNGLNSNGQTAETNHDETNTSDLESSQTESVDK